jgi:lysophospholipase L1-like esterase
VSVGAIVAWQLQEILPARPARLQVLAESGHTLEWQQRRLQHVTRRPEILIIYAGHNEISGRLFWWRDPPYYFDDELPTAWSLMVERAEAVSPLCGMIRETADKCRIAIPPPRTGYRALVDVPVYTSTEFTTLLLDFRRRLEAVVTYAERVGAIPVLILPPANDAGFEPNRSFLPAATPRGERNAFARDFLAARRLESGDPAAAITAYRALLARQPGFAEAHYRLAQLLDRASAWDEAYEHYVAARDLDGYPMRCVTAFHDIYREVAARHDCILIDSQAYFHAIGRHGLLDDHLFFDGMHPSFRGQIALAQAVLHSLRERGAFGWPADSPAPIIDPARCAEHFGLKRAAWRYVCAWGIMFYDLCHSMLYDQTRRRAMKQVFATAVDRIDAGEPAESLGIPSVGVPEPVPVSDEGLRVISPPSRTSASQSDSGRASTGSTATGPGPVRDR